MRLLMFECKPVTEANKIVTDALVLKELEKQGIDKNYVEFYQDYALPETKAGVRQKGKSPYAKFYRDLKSNKEVAVISRLPMVNANGEKCVPKWLTTKGGYVSGSNQFIASVVGNQVTIRAINDQPTGTKKGAELVYIPNLYLSGKKLEYKSLTLIDDPLNENYKQNTLCWDYGICKRYLRLIEGSILGRWEFAKNPKGEVKIEYNQSGSFKLKLGQYAVDEDTELVTKEVFETVKYPFQIGDTATFYPDANPETTTVDGIVRFQWPQALGTSWSNIHNGAGNYSDDSNKILISPSIEAGSIDGQWREIRRIILLFDLSALDNCILQDAILSLYGYSKADNLSCTPNINIYSSSPASNTALVPGDYASLGTTPFATAITYTSWSTNSYNNFNLNSVGVAYIQDAVDGDGIVKLGARNQNYDANDSVPNWSELNASYFYSYAAEQGEGYKPKLVITYINRIEVSTLPATNVSGTGAQLNGIVDDDRGYSGEVEARFKYREVQPVDYPVIRSVTGGNDASGTSHSINMPATVSAGNLLLVVFASDGTARDPNINDWTRQVYESSGGQCFAIFYKIAEGTEGGTTVTCTTSSSEATAHTTYCIGNWTDIEITATNSGSTTSTSPDPPSITPSWDTWKNLYIATCGYDYGRTVTAYPANYSNGRNDYASGSGGCGVGTATRTTETSSEDPGVFTINSADTWAAATIAIKGDNPAVWTYTDWQNSLSTDDIFYTVIEDLESETEYEFQAQGRYSTNEGLWTESEIFETTTPGTVVTPETVHLITNRYAPSVIIGTVITPPSGNLSLNEYAPSVLVSDHKTVTPDIAHLTTNRYAPKLETVLTILTRNLILTSYAPEIDISANKAVTPEAAHLTTTRYSPQLRETVTPTTAHLVLAGYTPSVVKGEKVTPGKLSLTLTRYAPSVTMTDHKTVTPAKQSLTITRYAPSMEIDVVIVPNVRHLSITRYAPDATIGVGVVTPQTAHLHLTSYAPEVTVFRIPASALKYIIEIHRPNGDLISVLENYYEASYSIRANEPRVLVFNLPGDDGKKANIRLPNELWLRDYKTGKVVKKFRPTRVQDIRS